MTTVIAESAVPGTPRRSFPYVQWAPIVAGAFADAHGDNLRLERKVGAMWDLVVSFAIHVSDCK